MVYEKLDSFILPCEAKKVKKSRALNALFRLDKDIKVRTGLDMVKRKQYRLRGGDVIDVEEFHDGNYGAPGKARAKRKKPTEEQIRKANMQTKMRLCRQRMLQYFRSGDLFATWTYEVRNRPPDMKAALRDFQDAMRIVRREYKKRGQQLFWIRNIEQGTKGAWHIHLLINEIGDTASIIQKAWKKGGTWVTEVKNSKFYDEDCSKLASYLTKDEHTVEKKEDGTDAKPKLRSANYMTSRNMPLPEPKVRKLVRWRDEPNPKRGYYIAQIFEGINPVTGYPYRRYTQIRIKRRNDDGCRTPVRRKRKRRAAQSDAKDRIRVGVHHKKRENSDTGTVRGQRGNIQCSHIADDC